MLALVSLGRSTLQLQSLSHPNRAPASADSALPQAPSETLPFKARGGAGGTHVLLGMSPGTGVIYKIDENAGTSTQVDVVQPGISGFARLPGTGSIFMSGGMSDGGNIYSYCGNPGSVGASGFAAVSDLAWNPTGSALYGTVTVAALADGVVAINPLTGAATLVGPMGGGIGGVDAIAFDPTTGLLYGSTGFFFDGSPGDVIVINPATGAAVKTGVMSPTPPCTVAGMDFAEDGTGFISIGCGPGAGGNVYSWSPATNQIDLIVNATGATGSISDICVLEPPGCPPLPGPVLGQPSGGDPGPLVPDDVYRRRLSVGRVWFRNAGDAIGKGDVTVDSVVKAVGSLFDEVQSNHYPKAQDVYKIKRAKSKCNDTACTGTNDKCNWFDIGEQIYKTDAVGQNFCEVEVSVQFNDLDKAFLTAATKWAVAVADVFACYSCIAIPGPWLPLCLVECGTALLTVAAAVDFMVNNTYDGTPDKLGRIHELFINSPVWTTGTTKECVNYGLTQTLKGDDARAELNWIVEKVGHQGIGFLPCWPQPPVAGGTASTLSGFQVMQLSGDELKLGAYVAGGNLTQPGDLIGTREIKFYLNVDNDQGTGSQNGVECGADYYVSLRHESDGEAMTSTPAIYCWDVDCCTGVPTGWTLVAPQTPYDVRVLSQALSLKVRLSAVGQPLGSFSSWVVAELDAVVQSSIPTDPCSSPPELAWTGDALCPYVESADLSALMEGDLSAPLKLVFSEPILADASDVALSPSVPFSLVMSPSGTSMEIHPSSAFKPGHMQVTLAGTITDTSGNALRKDPLRDPLAFCGQGDVIEVCTFDAHFLPSDSGGALKELFAVGEDIRVSGQGFPANVEAYLVFHDSLAEGNLLIHQSDTSPTTLPTGSFNVVLGQALIPQEYAIIADMNGNGRYDEFIDRTAGACGASLVVGDPCDVSVEDLALLWPLDEQVYSGETAEVMEARNGVIVDLPLIVVGRIGNALEFSQASNPQWVEVPPGPELAIEAAGGGGGDFSVDLWVRTTASTGQRALAGTLMAGGSGAIGYGLYLQDGEVRARLGDGATDVVLSSGSIVSNGAWHHVALVVDRDQAAKTGFFIDGIPALGKDATAVSGVLDSGGHFRMATSPLHGGFNGALDEVALTTRALSAADIAALVLLPAGGKCSGSCPGNSFSYGCDINPACSLSVPVGDGSVGELMVFGIDNPLGTQSPGCLAVLAIAFQPQPGFPCGLTLPNFGMSGPGAPGELLLQLSPGLLTLGGPVWSGPGTPALIPVFVPQNPAVIGLELFLQGAMIDVTPPASIPIALTNALKIDLKE